MKNAIVFFVLIIIIAVLIAKLNSNNKTDPRTYTEKYIDSIGTY